MMNVSRVLTTITTVLALCLTLLGEDADAQGLGCDPHALFDEIKDQGTLDEMENLGYSADKINFNGVDFYGHVEANPAADISDQLASFIDPSITFSSALFTNGRPWQRLSGDDIVVWRGCTPPNVAYWSIVPYSSDRVESTSGPSQPFGASLGDGINHLTAHTDTGQPFDAPFTVVFAGSQQAHDDFLAAAAAAGMSSAMLDNVNLVNLPADSFVWSSGPTTIPHDTFGFLVRIADLGVNPGNLAQYRTAQRNQPMLVLRGPAGPNHPNPPIGKSFGFEARDSKTPPGHPEENTPGNRRRFDRAVRLVKKFYQTGGNVEMELVDEWDMRQRWAIPSRVADSANPGQLASFRQPAYLFEKGEWCLDNRNTKLNVKCLFDNPNTHYSWPHYGQARSHVAFPADLFVVVGFDHTEFNKSIYNAIGLYGVDGPNGAFAPVPVQGADGLSNVDLDAHDNSAVWGKRGYDDVFIVQVAQGSHPNLRPEIAHMGDTDTPLSNDPLDTPFVFFGRAVLNPVTGTAPPPDELVPWKVLHFRCKNPAECPPD